MKCKQKLGQNDLTWGVSCLLMSSFQSGTQEECATRISAAPFESIPFLCFKLG